jgi:hypothetical protein
MDGNPRGAPHFRFFFQNLVSYLCRETKLEYINVVGSIVTVLRMLWYIGIIQLYLVSLVFDKLLTVHAWLLVTVRGEAARIRACTFWIRLIGGVSFEFA